MFFAFRTMLLAFLSTPSARRATWEKYKLSGIANISIHALREEGDLHRKGVRQRTGNISIHALREEGDTKSAVRPNACG